MAVGGRHVAALGRGDPLAKQDGVTDGAAQPQRLSRWSSMPMTIAQRGTMV